MLLGITIDSDDPHEVAAQMGYYLNGLAQSNRLIMRRQYIPPLYTSGVRYQVEPWAGTMQSLSNCREAIARGWLECKSAAAWRLAELRETQSNEYDANRFDINISWKDFQGDPIGVGLVPFRGIVRVFHATVKHADGRLEDPSRKLRRR